MKIIKNILFCFILTLFLFGCENQLNIKPDSSLTAASFWEDEGDVNAALNGAYDRFRSTFNDYDYLYWYEYRAGLITCGDNPYGPCDLYKKNDIKPSDTGTNWEDIYEVISSVNGIIMNIDKIEFTDSDEKNEILAQALFIRAWCYYTLVRVWGPIPIVTNFIISTDDPQLYPTRSDESDVFESIKSDIDDALTLFADPVPEKPYYISRAAILMLKTDVYLWTSKVINSGIDDLEIAESAVDKVLANSSYSMENDYEEVFLNEESKENILTIYFDMVEGGDQYGEYLCQGRAFVPIEYHNNPVTVKLEINRVVFSDHFYDNYRNTNSNDSRGTLISNDLEIDGINYRWSDKYAGELVGTDRFSTTDTRLYRFAEAILFKAEILAAKGNVGDAVIELNKIAERAYGESNYYTNGMTKEELEDSILHERIIEFAGEGKAWFDYIRFGKAFDDIPDLVGRENDKQGNILLLPVNVNTITLNKNIKQTPGY